MDNLKEYVFFLTYDDHDYLAGYRGRTQTIWATSPEEGAKKLKSWEWFGYKVKYLGYTMEEFMHKTELQRQKDAKDKARIQAAEAVKVEVENV